MKKLLLTFGLCFAYSLALGETKYVTDVLWVQMRAEGNGSASVLGSLRTGTQLEVLSVNDQTKYAEIKMTNGTVGWVHSRFLVNEPVARDQLNAIKSEYDALRSGQMDVVSLQEQLQTEQSRVSSLEVENLNLKAELKEIKSVASNSLLIEEQNKELIKIKSEQLTQIDLLQAETQRLRSNKEMWQWVFGAGILIIGGVIGMWMNSGGSTRRNDYF